MHVGEDEAHSEVDELAITLAKDIAAKKKVYATDYAFVRNKIHESETANLANKIS